MKAAIFGATLSAKSIYEDIKKTYEVIAYCDNDKRKWGGKMYDGVEIINPQCLLSLQWDEVIIISLSAMNVIKRQLLDMGVEENRINTTYIALKVQGREQFVRDYGKIVSGRRIPGEVAEAGVFQGEFAKIINDIFSDRKLYLFDTFEGFDERDIWYEEKNNFSEAKRGHLNLTSEELVLEKMPNPGQCIIKKGYFPDSAKDVSAEFCFVNLDMDLYKPTLEGLRFFYPRMVKGGIIIVHDYFSIGYEGVNAALDEFLEGIDEMIIPFPIGDGISIAVQKR